jgi:hypothetical protein
VARAVNRLYKHMTSFRGRMNQDVLEGSLDSNSYVKVDVRMLASAKGVKQSTS